MTKKEKDGNGEKGEKKQNKKGLVSNISLTTFIPCYLQFDFILLGRGNERQGQEREVFGKRA